MPFDSRARALGSFGPGTPELAVVASVPVALSPSSPWLIQDDYTQRGSTMKRSLATAFACKVKVKA